MIITTSPVSGTIPPSRVRSVQPVGFVAAAGDLPGANLPKWIGRNGNEPVLQARRQSTATEPAIVFRPHGSGAKQNAVSAAAAFRPRLPGKGKIAGVARLLSPGTPQAALALARRKSRRRRVGRRAPDVNRQRRHTVIIVLRLI